MTEGRRFRTLRRALKFAGIGLLLIVLLPAAMLAIQTARVWLGQPTLDGIRAVDGITAATKIVRDDLGVVHIEAPNEHDAYFALGYVHAQDRFFQMEMLRRAAWGRLAEVVGAPVLDFDLRMRRLGVGRLAEADATLLPDETRAVYQAYADGVNAWLKSRDGVAADELALLLAPEPEPWRIAHSLAWNRMMSLRLVNNWGSELMRLRLAERLSPKQLADLWPDYPASGPVSLPEISPSALAAAAKFAELAGPDDGSNAWVIAGERTASGAPLLANDPHLGLTTPAVWHLASIRAPGLRLAGAGAPGVPAIVLGHNGHVAWGLTNAGTDTSDLYVEQLDPKDPGRYLTPDGYAPLELRRETVRVRFQGDREIVIRSTRHGPLISDEDASAPGGGVLALAHGGLLPGERSAETLYRINRARAWPDILAALKLTRGPQQNVFYAGPDGVGMALGGDLPIRRRGDGYMPADGASTDGDWARLADVSAMPQTFRPQDGWIANANNKIAGDDFPLWLGREWAYPGRMAEIAARLSHLKQADLDAMAALQYDLTSPIARNLLEPMLSLLDRDALDARGRTLVAALEDWDLKTEMYATEPLVFYAWLRETIRLVFQDELGDAFPEWFGLRAEPLEHVLAERQVWCDDVRAAPVETCAEMATRAFAAALAWLEERYGDDPANWRWKKAHKARFRHISFGFFPVVNKIFDSVVPTPGGQETINRAAFRAGDEAAPFVQRHGPGLRAIYDLADLERSRFVIAPGQSGRLFSGNRSSLMERWRDAEYLTLEPPAAPASVLTLEPAS